MSEDFDKEIKAWEEGWRVTLTCKTCDKCIYSRRDGQYVSCECGAISIDQTPYYVRMLGSKKGYTVGKIKLEDTCIK